MYKLSKITAISAKSKDKRGREGFMVSFRPFSMTTTGVNVLSGMKSAPRWFWSGFSDGKNKFKADPLFEQIESGEAIVGSNVTGTITKFATWPYKIEGKEVSTYSIFTFDGEDALAMANKALKSNKSCVLLQDGELSAPNQIEVEEVLTPATA